MRHIGAHSDQVQSRTLTIVVGLVVSTRAVDCLRIFVSIYDLLFECSHIVS